MERWRWGEENGTLGSNVPPTGPGPDRSRAMLCPVCQALPNTLCKDAKTCSSRSLLVAILCSCHRLLPIPLLKPARDQPWEMESPGTPLLPRVPAQHIFTETLQPLAQEVFCIANEDICICNEDPSQVLGKSPSSFPFLLPCQLPL